MFSFYGAPDRSDGIMSEKPDMDRLDTDQPDFKAVRARIFGKVQGVWYRGWVQTKAARLGLYGWVRNREDGTVEALVCGTPNVVDRMLALLMRGPELARVDRIETEPAQGLTPKRFEVKPTV